MTHAYKVRGGHEAHLLHYATEVRKLGFETRVVVLDRLPREPHLFMRQLAERGVPLESIMDGCYVRACVTFTLLVLPWMAWFLLRGKRPRWQKLFNHLAERCTARRLGVRVRRDAPDLIHVLGRLPDTAWPMLPPERCILHHGTEGKLNDSWDPDELQAFKDFAARAARNFAPGSGVAANLRREFGIRQRIDPVCTICPDDAAARELASAQRPAVVGGAVRFGILCRMTPEKGLDVLFEAIRRFRVGHGEICFVFAGTGVLAESVREFVAGEGSAGIRYMETFDSPVSVLRDIDVFVHPSLSDAMPLAVAEALMCGRPCIVTRVGGLPDLVRDGEEGLVIEPGAAEGIVEAMERFAAMTTGDRAAFGKRARARYEAVCLPSHVAETVAAHYRAILG